MSIKLKGVKIIKYKGYVISGGPSFWTVVSPKGKVFTSGKNVSLQQLKGMLSLVLATKK
jgi:hypothetical protein